MKRRKIGAVIAGAVAVLAMMGGSALASSNPPPGPVTPSNAYPAATPDPGYIPGVDPGITLGSKPGISPNSIQGGNGYNMYWEPASDTYAWYYNGGSNGIYFTYEYVFTQVNVDGGAWSLYHDPDTGLCITWDGGPNQLYEKPCNSSKPSELWASSPVGGDWFFWNKYLKETAPNDCGNSDAPVITANAPDAPLLLECPEGGPTTYTTNQEWYADPVIAF